MVALVMGVKSYDFKNDSGEQVKGNKVYYVIQDDAEVEGVKGNLPMVVNVDNDCFGVVPGLYDFDFTMKQGKNNKAELVLKSVAFKSAITMVDNDGQVFIG